MHVKIWMKFHDRRQISWTIIYAVHATSQSEALKIVRSHHCAPTDTETPSYIWHGRPYACAWNKSLKAYMVEQRGGFDFPEDLSAPKAANIASITALLKPLKLSLDVLDHPLAV